MDQPLQIGKFVRVRISATNVEIGQLMSLDNQNAKATVETRNGFTISCRKAQIEPVMVVVCDLNGVLGSRRRKNDFLKRPDLDEFIPYLFKNFVVGVWSSCIRKNGEDIVRDCFGQYESQLLFTYFRDECTPAPTRENPYATIKDLNRLWSQYPESFDQNNTIIIDDSDEKCSHRFNALCPTPFDEKEISGSKIGLVEVIEALRLVVTELSLDPLRPLMVRRTELMRQLRDAEEAKIELERQLEEELRAKEEAGKTKGVLTLASGSQISFNGNGQNGGASSTTVCTGSIIKKLNGNNNDDDDDNNNGEERSVLSFFSATKTTTTTSSSNNNNIVTAAVATATVENSKSEAGTTTTSKFFKLGTGVGVSSTTGNFSSSSSSVMGGNSNSIDVSKLLSFISGGNNNNNNSSPSISTTNLVNHNNTNSFTVTAPPQNNLNNPSNSFQVTSLVSEQLQHQPHHNNHRQQQNGGRNSHHHHHNQHHHNQRSRNHNIQHNNRNFQYHSPSSATTISDE